MKNKGGRLQRLRRNVCDEVGDRQRPGRADRARHALVEESLGGQGVPRDAAEVQCRIILPQVHGEPARIRNYLGG